MEQRSHPENDKQLIKITILVPMYVHYQYGVHAVTTEDMGNKINLAMSKYQSELIKKAADKIGVPLRTFIRQVALRSAAEIIGYYDGTVPPIDSTHKPGGG